MKLLINIVSYSALFRSLEGDWKFILERVSRHKQAAPLFKEAYNLFKLSDEESRMNSGEDGVKQRRQLHMFLDEALSYNMLTRHDIDRIEEEIAAGARTVQQNSTRV